jgi:hypothetical protein
MDGYLKTYRLQYKVPDAVQKRDASYLLHNEARNSGGGQTMDDHFVMSLVHIRHM